MRDELGRARRAGRGQHPLAGETCEAVLFIDRDGIAAKVDLTFSAEILVRRVADDGVDFGLRNDAGEPPRRKIGRTDHQPRREAVEFDQRARRDELRPGADQHRFSRQLASSAGEDRRGANIASAQGGARCEHAQTRSAGDEHPQAGRLSAGCVHRVQ